MSTTIFEKIIAKEVPADIVFEDDAILAFRDVNPQAPVHVLVIPKKKIENYNQLPQQTSEAVGQLFQGAAKVADTLELSEDGYRIVINCGAYGGQTVDYIHLHLLGGRPLKWPPG